IDERDVRFPGAGDRHRGVGDAAQGGRLAAQRRDLGRETAESVELCGKTTLPPAGGRFPRNHPISALTPTPGRAAMATFYARSLPLSTSGSRGVDTRRF